MPNFKSFPYNWKQIFKGVLNPAMNCGWLAKGLCHNSNLLTQRFTEFYDSATHLACAIYSMFWKYGR